MEKLHYFEEGVASPLDIELEMAKMQGYVPQECLLGGVVVFSEMRLGSDPCYGCNGPRDKCMGRKKGGIGG